jgi:hypothetical protein
MSSSRDQLSTLRRILVDRFSQSELKDLAFDLGVDYEALPNGSKSDKARELVAYFDRRNRIPLLVREIRNRRPDIQLWRPPFDPEGELVWISTHEAILETGYGSTYLLDLAAQGRVTARQEGNTWLFDREVLLAYVKGWIGTEEASQLTDYAVAHIRWLAREGIVRAEKVRGIWLIHRESLLEYSRARGQI